MILTLPWLDLSDAQRQALLAELETSFHKKIKYPTRFVKNSCHVYWYYPRPFDDWTAVAIMWNLAGTVYMDKFFTKRPKASDCTRQRKGEGSRFFQELQCHVRSTGFVWRTDPVLAKHFYGKSPVVKTLARHGEYVYQGVFQNSQNSQNRQIDPEVLLGMTRLPSAF